MTRRQAQKEADMAEEGTTTEGTENSEGTGTSEGTEQAPDFKAEAEKWKTLSRKHESQAKANAAAAKRLAEIEESQKSEAERASEALKTAETRAADAEARATRYEVAFEKNVPQKLMKFLSGSTREEIEASADELLEAVKPDTGEKNGEAETGGKPKERLRSGAATDAEPDVTDPAKLAALIPRGQTF